MTKTKTEIIWIIYVAPKHYRILFSHNSFTEHEFNIVFGKYKTWHPQFRKTGILSRYVVVIYTIATLIAALAFVTAIIVDKIILTPKRLLFGSRFFNKSKVKPQNYKQPKVSSL